MFQYDFVAKGEIRTDKRYGSNQSSMFAAEDIKKGQVIFRCDPSKCGAYLNYLENPEGMTKNEIEEYISKNPESKEFIFNYYCMKDDDSFNFDKKLRLCPCYYTNHSCDSNCCLKSDEYYTLVAKKDIKAGEEITLDYQILGTESYCNNEWTCKCGSHKCRGVLKFDYYRNIDWVNENYKYCSVYLKRRIDELKTKWFSSRCILVKYNNKTELGLIVFKKVIKDELVAIYSDPKNITRESHFIRHSDNPTCYVNKDGEVYAKETFQPDTELTLNFNAL